MNQYKSKPGHVLVGSRASTASEGLRILARMIARHLIQREVGVDGQCASDGGRAPIPDALKREGPGNNGPVLHIELVNKHESLS